MTQRNQRRARLVGVNTHTKAGWVALLPLTVWLAGCQTETITRSQTANETFYVQNQGASMRVSVRGNTASQTFMVVVHGGPGGSAYFYRTGAMKTLVEPELAVVYWDQRSAGASQGGTLVQPLSLSQYADDLKQVIQSLTHRYGSSARVFVMGHSWGGLLTSAFLTQGDNQRLVRGWLFVNASHNYPLNDELTRQKLLRYGQAQLRLGKNRGLWQGIVDYCGPLTAPYTLAQSRQLNEYAYTAMSLIDGFTPLNEDDVLRTNLLPDRIPFTSAFSNLIATGRSPLPASLVNAGFSSALRQVTIPVLVCAGAHDFVCPNELGDDLLTHVGSPQTQQLLFARTGHNLEEQEAYCRAFVTFIRTHQ